MNRIQQKAKAVKYHLSFFLFDKFAIPKKRRFDISKALIKRYAPVNSTVIDCGAHDGQDTIQLARKFPKGKVYAFEPVPEIFERLKRRTSKQKNVSCFNLALGDKNEEMDFYVSSGDSDASSSILKPKEHLKDHPAVFFDRKIRVKTLNIDTWAKQNKIGAVDVLWLDMQGYELKMLKASESILKNVKVIHTEVSNRETYEGVNKYDELKKFLIEMKFELLLEAIPDNSDMGNVLFINKSLYE